MNRILALMVVGVTVIVGATPACSTSTSASAAGSCDIRFSGNFSDASTHPSCASLTLSPDAGALNGWILAVSATSNLISQFNVEVDFGAFPAAGSFTSDTLTGWSAVAVSSNLMSDGSYCTYDSGSELVPTGSLSLNLASVALTDGGLGAAHGTLQLVLYVHAPATLDCGSDDIENVSIVF